MMWERFGLSVMRGIDPERAHALAIRALRTGILPLGGPVTSPRLAVDLAGLHLPSLRVSARRKLGKPREVVTGLYVMPGGQGVVRSPT